MNYNEIFRDKTRLLALDTIKEFSAVPYSDTVSVIRKQIIRCSTSTASNYRAVSRAKSSKERYAKLSIVVEEVDETLSWLELSEELDVISEKKIIELKQKAEEIVKATATYRKKLSQ